MSAPSLPSIVDDDRARQEDNNSILDILDGVLREECPTQGLLRSIRDELGDMRRRFIHQATVDENRFRSIVSNIQSIKSWGESIAGENGHLRNEVQRLTTDYNNISEWYYYIEKELAEVKTKLHRIQTEVPMVISRLQNALTAVNAEATNVTKALEELTTNR